jgi:hypothetical protein
VLLVLYLASPSYAHCLAEMLHVRYEIHTANTGARLTRSLLLQLCSKHLSWEEAAGERSGDTCGLPEGMTTKCLDEA